MVGYQCLENTRQTLWLVNSKRNLEIRYDMRKYPCIYGKISHIRELRCNIIIRYGYHSVECFSMRDFKALHIEDDVLVYNDQEHFEQAILEFTERLLTDGIPILDELVSSLVYVEENFYERLSQEPEKQAKEFAICHSLEMNGTLDNQVLAEEWLRQQKNRTTEQACLSTGLMSLSVLRPMPENCFLQNIKAVAGRGGHNPQVKR